jgi:hypothetical protein
MNKLKLAISFAAAGVVFATTTTVSAATEKAADTYVVHYYKNGAKQGQTQPSFKVSVDKKVSVSNKGKLIKPAYQFTGWNTLANGKGKTYKPGNTVKAKAGTTLKLYAQWKYVGTPIQDKKIILNINGKKRQIPKKQLKKLVQKNGKVSATAVSTWVSKSLKPSYDTLTKPVYFKNPENKKTYRYKNNGAYGWTINATDATAKITAALKAKAGTANLKLAINGNKAANANKLKDYVYINLWEQKMFVYRNNKLKVSTYIISGRNNKGTATVPGFHTIAYKSYGQTLRGTGIDGVPYAVPVTYFEPLLSRGTYAPYMTGIGIHDSNKTVFGSLSAWRTLNGSNGCINTPPGKMPSVWSNTYAGMPVIVWGNIYKHSPGQYDKPVDFGKVVKAR